MNDLDGVLDEFDRVLGLEHLKAIHMNDSMTPFGAHKDRHACIGEGMIGETALMNVIGHPRLQGIPIYLETPLEDEGHRLEIERIKKLMEV